MPKRPREIEKEILDDGWIFKRQEGSHRHYVHPTKSGKVTIPFHSKELSKIVEKSVHKTLTNPAWLNAAAQERKINFSQTLQEALLAKIRT
ncbi:MAG: type II toxin-antitoxin system HicA family toxin [Oribacterium sp.]|nr:type II toxin-antitoxin system HicA family toxin [Oribacterium sp.]